MLCMNHGQIVPMSDANSWDSAGMCHSASCLIYASMAQDSYFPPRYVVEQETAVSNRITCSGQWEQWRSHLHCIDLEFLQPTSYGIEHAC